MATRITPIPGGTDPVQQLAIMNKNFAELDAALQSGLFYDNNGVPSISIGVQQDKTSRIRVSKPGVDVTTATDAQLAFNSAQNVLKVVSKLTTSFTLVAPAGPVTNSSVQLTHNLGYIPTVFANIDILEFNTGTPSFIVAQGVLPLPHLTMGTSGGAPGAFVTVGYAKVSVVTATDIFIGLGLQPGYTMQGTIIAYILQETAA